MNRMPGEQSNEQLLVAVLAVQLEFADSDRVMAAAAAWMTDRSRSLAERLEADGLISKERRGMLEAMVREAVRAHGGDSHKTMASLGGAEMVRQTFAGSIVLEPGGDIRIATPAAAGKDESGAGEITPMCAGRYELGAEHGRGGQARVLLAFDKHIGREIAWKEVLPQGIVSYSKDGKSASARSGPAVRFLREARITAQLEHPNIVPVYEVGRRDDGQAYYTMRLVHGKTLARAIAECNSPADRMRLLSHFADLCHAVAFAHSRGVIHRDIKPDNVMVGEFGETVVLDWGLAKVEGKQDFRQTEIERQARLRHQTSAGDTIEGAALGTPAYMSPEQAEGLVDEIDERSDVWGLGAVLYEILTGHPPFMGETPYEIIGRVMKEKVVPVREIRPEAPAELVAVAECALRKEKRKRYGSVREMTADVTAYMTGERVGAYEYGSWDLLKRFAAKNKPAIVAAGLVLAMIIASLVIVLFSYRREAEARHREHLQRLRAHSHLAQAYAREAGRLLHEKMPLSARIFAAASLVYNPANQGSEFYDPEFEVDNQLARRVKMDADSQIYSSDQRFVESLEWLRDLHETITSLAVSPDGKQLAVGDHTGRMLLLNSSDGKTILETRAHPDCIWGLAYTPSGRKLVTGSADQSIKVWEVGTKRPLLNIGAKAVVLAVAVSPQGDRVVGGMKDGSIVVWSLVDGRSLMHLGPHSGSVRDVTFSPDGSRLVSASWDKTAVVWDTVTGKKLHELLGHTDALYRVSYSSDGRRIATGSYDRSLRLWDADTGKLEGVLQDPDDSVQALAYSPGGEKIASAGSDGCVRLWSTKSKRLLIAIAGHHDVVSALTFTPDGKHLVSGSYDKTIRFWRLRNSDGLLRLPHSDWVYGLGFSPDGSLIATGGWDHSVTVWDASDGRSLWSARKHTAGVFTTVFSPDGQLVASCGIDKNIMLWDAYSGRLLRTLSGHRARVMGLAFSSDASILVSACYDKTVRLWDVATGREKGVLGDHGGRVFDVVFSPDGRFLASACDDKLVRIYEAKNLTLLKRLSGHLDWVSSVDFSPDGRLLASCGKDRTIVIWRTTDWSRVRTLSGHAQWVNSVRFSKDGQLLVSASDDEQVIVWKVNSGRPLLRIRTTGGATGAVFSPDGNRLAVTDHDDVVLYPLTFPAPGRDPRRLQADAERLAGLKLSTFELQGD